MTQKNPSTPFHTNGRMTENEEYQEDEDNTEEDDDDEPKLKYQRIGNDHFLDISNISWKH
jgi:hypothetical protein